MVQPQEPTAIALIFVEGDTEVEFFNKLLPMHLHGVSKKLINLHGNFNIYNKILDKIIENFRKHKFSKFNIYCFVDRESRAHNPPLDIDILKNKIIEHKTIKKESQRIQGVHAIIATQMIESWFFHDINGIYAFLRTPVKERKPKKFIPVERYTHLDLARLFERYGKVYIKGTRCANFIENLNTNTIYDRCNELRNGIILIKNSKS